MGNAVIIGAGPAGLMAAEVLAKASLSVTLVDQKPSVARKFLMAGKSGLNLTKDDAPDAFLKAYGDSRDWLAPMLSAFGPSEVKDWAKELGQELFTGSTGRVFPKAMKASPLLRAWLLRLDALGVERRLRWKWTGWDGDALTFETPEGRQTLTADATILALGGGSWARLGSDGKWLDVLQSAEVETVPFQPSNSGVTVDWSPFMDRHLGSPVKNIALSCGDQKSRGEIIISKAGFEGGGIYTLTAALRAGGSLTLDLLPDVPLETMVEKLSRPKGKASIGNFLRKALKLDATKLALLNEFSRPLPTKPQELAAAIKSLPITCKGLRPLDEAISTVGGVPNGAVDDQLMLAAKPGVFVAGEMLDWDAPTGGYLITACLATGAWAGSAAADYVMSDHTIET